MISRLFAIYDLCSKQGWHGAVILLTACAILLVRSGFTFSTVLAVITYFGCITLIFDPAMRRRLVDPNGLGPASLLLAAAVAWQIAGFMLREPEDPRTLYILGSAGALLMLLPVFAAALHYDPGLLRRLLVVLFVVGGAAALISLVRHGLLLNKHGGPWPSGLLTWRLVPIGRANHEILGAGALVSSLFAGLVLWRDAAPRLRPAMAVGLGVIALAIALTQSRGPMLGLCMAIGATIVTLNVRGARRRLAVALGLALVCAIVPVAMVVGEPWLKSLFCSSDAGLCRTSARQDVWSTVLSMIPERPWFGIGPAFRFPEGSVTHAHNGFLGLSFFFGIPAAILFGALVAFALARTLRAPAPGRTYALLGLFFGIALMSTDVPNPFAFINAHFLFLWFPLLIGVVLGSDPDHHLLRGGRSVTPA